MQGISDGCWQSKAVAEGATVHMRAQVKKPDSGRQEDVELILHVVASTHEISARAFQGVAAARDSQSKRLE